MQRGPATRKLSDCMSVRPSVCLSNAWIVTKQKKVPPIFLYHTGFILSVESNQNVESKKKNVESKTEKCGVQNNIGILKEIRYFQFEP